MQPLESYLTKEGWKADSKETGKNLSGLYRSPKDLTDIIRNRQGGAGIGALFLIGGVCMTCLGMKNFFGENPNTSLGAVQLFLAAANYALAKSNF